MVGDLGRRSWCGREFDRDLAPTQDDDAKLEAPVAGPRRRRERRPWSRLATPVDHLEAVGWTAAFSVRQNSPLASSLVAWVPLAAWVVPLAVPRAAWMELLAVWVPPSGASATEAGAARIPAKPYRVLQCRQAPPSPRGRFQPKRDLV